MKEAEIRPPDLFRQFLALAREDAESFFDREQFIEVACPGCTAETAHLAFEKLGFRYVVCDACGSLYTSPRPTRQALRCYYQQGKAVQFFGSDFYRVTAESRKEKIFRPRAELIGQLLEIHGGTKKDAFLDVGAGYGIFLDELRRLDIFERVIGIEPSSGLAAICHQKGFEVIEKYAEDLSDDDIQAGMATAFEVLEHVFDPAAFLHGVRRAMRDRGLMIFTTLSISGFDLQALWENSNSIYPPHHINLLSTEGIEALVRRSGFEIVELTTPGKLDIDIISNAVKENPNLPLPRFISYILKYRNEEVWGELQQFLQKHRLSSHVRVVARKRTAG